MKIYATIGIIFITSILFTKYHYLFSSYRQSDLSTVTCVLVFWFYFILATLVLFGTILFKKTPSYKSYTIHIIVGFLLGVFSSFLVTGGDQGYAFGYVLLGIHAFISIIFFMLCLISIPGQSLPNKIKNENVSKAGTDAKKAARPF